MKFGGFVLICYAVFVSSTFAAKSAVKKKDLANPSPTLNKEPSSDSEIEHLKKHIERINDTSDKSAKSKTKERPEDGKLQSNSTDTLLHKLDILLNATEAKNTTKKEETWKTATYDVKHNLTAEQKYYMLRTNLLGIGIRVVQDIIPIPDEEMKALLNKSQAAREASSNMTTGQGMHIGDLVISLLSKNNQEIILVGVLVGIVVIGALIFVCGRRKSPESSYYGQLQGGGGGSVPMN